MKKEFIQTIKVLVLAIVIGAGSMFVSAQSSGTPVPPPAGCTGPSVCNTPPPINAGSITQVKDGGLSVAYNTGSFFSWKNSYLLGNTYVGLASSGGTPAINATLRVNGDTYVNPLSNGNNDRVCADASGKLVLCAAPPVTTTNTQIYTMVNGVQTTSGSLGTGNPNSFTPPANATNIVVKAWGAGGGGGNFAHPNYNLTANPGDCLQNCQSYSTGMQAAYAATNGVPVGYNDNKAFPSGAGGGGGAFKMFTLATPTTLSINVGAGGPGGKRIAAEFDIGPYTSKIFHGNDGQNGTSTTVGSTTVPGGSGGHGAQYSYRVGPIANSVSKIAYAGGLGGVGTGVSAGTAGGAGSYPAVPGGPNYQCLVFGPRTTGGLGGSGNGYGQGGKGGGGGGDDPNVGISRLGSGSQLSSAIIAQTGACVGQKTYDVGQDGAPGRVEITWDETN